MMEYKIYFLESIKGQLKYHKNYLFLMISIIFVSIPFFLFRTGLGQDDCAIILAGLKQLESKIFSFKPMESVFFRLFDFSHGGFNLIWILGFYVTAAFFKISLYTWIFTLPAAISAWLTAIVIYLFTYKITKKRFISFLAFLIYIFIPIAIGMGRQYFYPLTFIRIFFLYSLAISLSKNSVFWKKIAILILGLMIFSDNGFPIFLFLGLLLIFLNKLKDFPEANLLRKISLSVYKTFLYFADISILLPVFIIVVYIFLYIKPVHAGYGFIYYTLQKKMSYAFSFHKDFFISLFENYGYGIGLIFPVVLFFSGYLVYIKDYIEKRADIFVIYLWFLIWIILGFAVQPWALGKMYLFEFTPIPVAILGAINIDYFLNRFKRSTVNVLIIIIFLNIISCTSMIFEFPYSSPQNVYGTPKGYDYTKTYKAVGALLRSEGYHPLKMRDLPLENVPIVLCANPSYWTPYPAIFYWGVDTSKMPNNYTNTIVYLKDSGGDKKQLESCLVFVKKNKFNIKYIIYKNEKPIAWLYYRNYNMKPIKHERDYLIKEWDKKYANLRDIKTTGPHAL